MKLSNAIALLFFAAIAATTARIATAQQEFPARPVRIVVPFPPGGSTDPMARMLAARLNEKWAESVVVDNRPGGNTLIGYSVVAKAAPDGYTMGWAGPALVSNPSPIAHMPYDPVKDFMVKQGTEAYISTAEETSALIKSDVGRYAKSIKAANIKME